MIRSAVKNMANPVSSGMVRGIERAGVVLPDPLAFWPMQEGSGTTLGDTVGSLNMTISGATWSTAGRNGTNCLSFTTSQFAYINDPFYLPQFTICAWIYVLSSTQQMAIIAKRNILPGPLTDSDDEISVARSPTDGKLQLALWDDAGTLMVNIFTSNAVPLNEWVHLCVGTSGDGGTAFIYINGELAASTSQTGVLRNTSTIFQLGGRILNDVTRYYQGMMQEVRIYNTAITSAQALAIYNLPPP